MDKKHEHGKGRQDGKSASQASAAKPAAGKAATPAASPAAMPPGKSGNGLGKLEQAVKDTRHP